MDTESEIRNIKDDYLLEKRHTYSGLYGSFYIAEHISTKEKRLVKVISLFVVNNKDALIKHLDKLKTIVGFVLTLGSSKCGKTIRLLYR